MSFKKIYDVEESSSDEYENYEKFKQINKATSKSKRKLKNDGSKLSNKKKDNPGKNVYRSSSNGTTIKISYINPDVETLFHHEDDTQAIGTSSNTKNINQGSNDILTNNDLILHKKEKAVSKKIKCPYIPKEMKKKKSHVDPDIKTSGVTVNNTQEIITSSKTQQIERNLPLDDSKNTVKIEPLIIEISSDSEDNLTNDNLTLPPKIKVVPEKRRYHSFPKTTKKKVYYVDSDIETPVVHQDDTQRIIKSNYVKNLERNKQQPSLNNFEISERSEQITVADSSGSEKLTTADIILPMKKTITSKKRGRPPLNKTSKKKYSFKQNLKVSVDHKDDTQEFVSNNMKNITDKSNLEDFKDMGEIEQLSEVKFENEEKLTNFNSILSSKKKVSSKKNVHCSYIETSVALEDDIGAQNTPLDDTATNSGEINEIIKDNLKSNNILTTNDLMLPIKKRGRSLNLKGAKKKIYCDDSEVGMSVVHQDNTRRIIISSNSKNIEVESSLEEDSEKIEDFEQSNEILLEGEDELTNNNLNLSKKKIVASKRSKRHSFPIRTIKKICNIDSDLEKSDIYNDNSQIFKISSNTRNLELESSLDDNMDNSGKIQHIESNLENQNILTTHDLTPYKKKKVVSKKRVHSFTSKRTKRKKQNVDSDVEVPVDAIDDIQGSITRNNKRTLKQKSSLNDTNNIVNVKHSIETNSETNVISTTYDLSLSLQKKCVSRKGRHSISKGKNKNISNTSITSSEESKTNNSKLNLEHLTINEIQPIVLMEVLNDSLLQKSSNKNLKTADKNFGPDNQNPNIADEPLKPAKPLLRTKNTLNCQVSPSSNSSNSDHFTRFGRKIKSMKSNDSEKSSTVQKYSSPIQKDDKSSEEYDNETTDTSKISSLETTISPVTPIQLVNNSSSTKLKLYNKINRNIDPPSVLNNLANDTSPNIEIDWMKVDSNQLAKIDLLQKEVDLLDYVHQLRSALRTSRANYEIALETLQQLYDLDIDAVMLIKNTDVVDTIVKVTKYVGNAREWNLCEQEVLQHAEKARQVRRKAQVVFDMFKSLFTIPDGKTFQEVYIKEVNDFLAKTKNKSCFQIINESSFIND